MKVIILIAYICYFDTTCRPVAETVEFDNWDTCLAQAEQLAQTIMSDIRRKAIMDQVESVSVLCEMEDREV